MDYNGTEYVPSTPKAIDVYFKWPLRYTTLSYGVQIFEFFELNVTYFLRHFVTYLETLPLGLFPNSSDELKRACCHSVSISRGRCLTYVNRVCNQRT